MDNRLRKRAILSCIMIFQMMLLNACTGNHAATQRNEAAPPSTSLNTEAIMGTQHIQKTLDTNLSVDADVSVPAAKEYSSYLTNIKSFSADDMSKLFLQQDTSKQTLSKVDYDPNGLNIKTENGSQITSFMGSLTYSSNSDREAGIASLISSYAVQYPESPAFTDHLTFASREDAIKEGAGILEKLDAGFLPSAKNVLALTHNQLSDWQTSLLQDPDYKTFVDAGKAKVIDDWSGDDDVYYIIYSFKQDDLQVYNQQIEPGISLAADSLPPRSMYAEMLISPKGIQYLNINGSLSIKGQAASNPIISSDAALEKVKEKYSQLILSTPYTITKAFVEYIPIPDSSELSANTKITLTPYWCFVIKITTDDKGHTAEIAERFNAWTGADLKYGG